MIDIKKLVVGVALVSLLTGCTTPPAAEPGLNLSQVKLNQATSDSSNQATDSGQAADALDQKTKTQGESMRQLKDFATIEATQATVVTTKGEITFELYRDQAPITTINFLSLAKEGFYDGIVFHRVIEDFMAQVGDPQTKDESLKAQWGSGGPGYTIPDEFNAELKHDGPGVVSMANTGQPNTGGSQFFITFEATPWLDGKHTVFGKVTQGLDVLQQITVGDKILSVKYE